MVGMMMGMSWREKAATLLNSAKFSTQIPTKLDNLRQLKELLLNRDPSLLPEFVPLLFELQTDRASPVRKFLAEMIGQIGLKHMDFVPEIVPVLTSLLKDDTPAVARQAITSGTELFRSVIEKVAIQGLHSSELDDSLVSSWAWILKLKDIIQPIAFQGGCDGVRLLAVKFVEAIILLYTPDPNGSSQPLPHQDDDGKILGFNMSWLRGGHPVLNLGELATEASKSLGLLLDQLRFPSVRSLSNSMVIVIINSLSAIAKRRPSLYGRILPVLLGLDPSISVMKGVQISGAHHALKNSFLACLKCTHPGAAPWRDRLVSALKSMNAGELAERAVYQAEKICDSVEHSRGETHPKEDTLPVQAVDAIHIDLGRKRGVAEETTDLLPNNDISGKRVRSAPLDPQGSNNESHKTKSSSIRDDLPLVGVAASSSDVDTGPVQQLVAMFGALVAQGDKAAESLEILISSISADLLAEVVMANIRYLPPVRPKSEGEEESMLVGSNGLEIQSASFVSNILSLSRAFPQLASLLDAQTSTYRDVSKFHRRDEQQIVPDIPLVCATMNDVTQVMSSTGDSVPSVELVPPGMESSSSIPSDVDDMGILENEIPGLNSTLCSNEMKESIDVSHSQSSIDELRRKDQEQVATSGSTLPVDVSSSGCISSDRSEALSPKLAVAESSQTSSSSTSVFSSQFLLPKMSAPIVNLTDDQKDQLQKLAYVRIIEAYKQIAVAGGSQMHFSLLACLGVEYPLELDSWVLLQKHILSDYISHEGHELTLRVLYRLYREAEQDQDFFSSTTATSVYETFLLAVAETLRDSFPASDKSLSRLLGEVPYLPKAAFKFLENLCSPGNNEKNDRELQSGDRVTQGLSTVWSLILLRPPIRDACLEIALQSAVHHLEEVRMKAIRLVANKLYPITCIAKKIEDFGNEMLLSVVNRFHAMESMDAEVSTSAMQKDADSERPPSGGQPSASVATKESSDTRSLCSAQSISSEAQRCMSLYFALCTKKHSLFRQIFIIYRSIPKAVKQAVHRQIPILVRTIGTSSELLSIISDPPTGSESVLKQVLYTLTDGTIPSSELIFTVRKLYDSKLKDMEILIPILPYLSKDEVLPIFPQVVDLPPDKFQVALARLLQGSSQSGPVLTPAEVLIAIHGLDPERDGIPLKKVTDACSACFDKRQIFTQQVLAKVLNQLVEQIPLPLLFMRTVIQAIGAFPALVDFIMEILSRLVSKQIWKYPKLWVGFLKCALQTKPQSFNVLLQLPAAQLENALNRTSALRPPLVAHADQPNIRSSLPRSTLVVLGLVPDSQTSSQAPTIQTQTAETSNSGAAETVTTMTPESAAVS